MLLAYADVFVVPAGAVWDPVADFRRNDALRVGGVVFG